MANGIFLFLKYLLIADRLSEVHQLWWNISKRLNNLTAFKITFYDDYILVLLCHGAALLRAQVCFESCFSLQLRKAVLAIQWLILPLTKVNSVQRRKYVVSQRNTDCQRRTQCKTLIKTYIKEGCKSR